MSSTPHNHRWGKPPRIAVILTEMVLAEAKRRTAAKEFQAEWGLKEFADRLTRWLGKQLGGAIRINRKHSKPNTCETHAQKSTANEFCGRKILCLFCKRFS